MKKRFYTMSILALAGTLLTSCIKEPIIIPDTTAPVINATRTSFEHIMYKTNISDTKMLQCANAIDDVDGDVTADMFIEGYDQIVWSTAKTYNLNYVAKDKSDNISKVPFTLTIREEQANEAKAVIDETAPVISLTTPSFTYFTTNEPFTPEELLEGATANDNVDGDLTDSIVLLNYDSIDWTTLGQKRIIASVRDKSNNFTNREITVMVYLNEDAPYFIGDTFDFIYYTKMEHLDLSTKFIAQDDDDVSLPPIEFNYDAVLWDVPNNIGESYPVTMYVRDQHGNETLETANITVIEQPAPIFEPKEYVHVLGDEIPDLTVGLSATCVTPETLTIDVDPTSAPVNWNTTGVYRVKYSVTTEYPKTTYGERDIAVVGDATKPQLFFTKALLKDGMLRYDLEQPGDIPTQFKDGFIRAFDKKDGEITNISVGEPDISLDYAKMYKLTYDVVNSEGIAAEREAIDVEAKYGSFEFVDGLKAFEHADASLKTYTNYRITTDNDDTKSVALGIAEVKTKSRVISTRQGDKASYVSLIYGLSGAMNYMSDGGFKATQQTRGGIINVNRVRKSTSIIISTTRYIDSNLTVRSNGWDSEANYSVADYPTLHGVLPGEQSFIVDSSSVDNISNISKRDGLYTFTLTMNSNCFVNFGKVIARSNRNNKDDIPASFTSSIITVYMDASGNFVRLENTDAYSVETSLASATVTHTSHTIFEKDNLPSSPIVIAS